MREKVEFLIKVYENGNIRLPIKVRQQLSINKGGNLVLKIDKHGSINIEKLDHKMESLRNELSAQLGDLNGNVDEFLEFKKLDNSKY